MTDTDTTTPTAAPYRPALGDLVTIDHDRATGTIYKVTKVNKTTADVVEDGKPNGQTARAHMSLLRKHEPGTTPAAPLGRPYEFRSLEHLPCGAVVKVTGRDGLWVVLADKHEKINLALLGGDGDRYLRCTWRMVTPVDIATFLK